MSISTDSKITWVDFTTSVLNSIKSVCCNIDAYASNVPAELKTGTASNPQIWSFTTTGSGGNFVAQTFRFYANNTINLISLVSSSTVNSEWNNFLRSAGINAHSNKLIQANELGLAIGLCSQFMAYHLKRIHSRRQIIGGSLFQGTKYITGTCTPKYTLPGITSSLPVPTITDSNITSTVRQNIIHDGTNYGILDRENNPVLHRIYLN